MSSLEKVAKKIFRSCHESIPNVFISVFAYVNNAKVFGHQLGHSIAFHFSEVLERFDPLDWNCNVTHYSIRACNDIEIIVGEWPLTRGSKQ